MFAVRDTRELAPQETEVKRLIAPFSTFYELPLIQRILHRFFKRSLKTVADFIGTADIRVEVESWIAVCSTGWSGIDFGD
jgi:hypothetical protein